MAAVVLATVVCTLLFWLIKQPTFMGVSVADYPGVNSDYEPQVRSLLTGDEPFSARYPPGFPLLLAGLFHVASFLRLSLDMTLAAFILVCTGLANVWLYLIGRSIWGVIPALGSAAMWITYVPALWLTTYPSPETPFMTALFGAMLLFGRALWEVRRRLVALFGSGFLIGIAMLIRPIAIVLGPVLLIVFWTVRSDLPRSRRFVFAASFLLALLVPVVPWETWVHGRTGRIVPLSTLGTAGLLEGLTYGVDPDEGRHVALPSDVEQLQRDILAKQYRELTSVGEIAAYMRQQLLARPASVFKLYVIKAAESWYATDSTRYDRWVLLLQLLYLPGVLLATWVSWKAGGRSRDWTIVAWATCIYFWVMTTATFSIARYMVPGLGLVWVLLGAIVVRARRSASRSITREIAQSA